MLWRRNSSGQLPPAIAVPIDEVRRAIESQGEWSRAEEWRISTVTSTRIRVTEEGGHRAFHVRVECDYILEACCPTVVRAAELTGVYEALIQLLWQERGWPSWASKSQMRPPGVV